MLLTDLSRVGLFQLFQKCLRFKIFWNVVVQACNDLVNLFFPGRIQVFSSLDCFKELLKSLLNNPAETVRDLRDKMVVVITELRAGLLVVVVVVVEVISRM